MNKGEEDGGLNESNCPTIKRYAELAKKVNKTIKAEGPVQFHDVVGLVGALFAAVPQTQLVYTRSIDNEFRELTVRVCQFAIQLAKQDENCFDESLITDGCDCRSCREMRRRIDAMLADRVGCTTLTDQDIKVFARLGVPCGDEVPDVSPDDPR